MSIAVRACALSEIAALRAKYRAEMDCQIIHDSIHVRPGWSTEYALEIDGSLAGYGSVAIAGPWKEEHTLYEFYVDRPSRLHIFDLFAALCAECHASKAETQTNDPFLFVMLQTFARGIQADAILFEDQIETHYAPAGALFRAREPRRR